MTSRTRRGRYWEWLGIMSGAVVQAELGVDLAKGRLEGAQLEKGRSMMKCWTCDDVVGFEEYMKAGRP